MLPSEMPCRRTSGSLAALVVLLFSVLSREASASARPAFPVPLPAVPFVPNEGQLDVRVAFEAGIPSGRVFVMRDGSIVHSLQSEKADGRREPVSAPPAARFGWALRETFLGEGLEPRGAERTSAHVSSFVGDDPACWRESLPTYASVDLGLPWRGIRVTLRLNEGRVEKLFRLDPGISAGAIAVRVDGARSLRLSAGGELVAETELGEVTLSAPVAYQESAAGRRTISASYGLSENRYGFRLGTHDPALPVVIDPIVRTTYVGGSGGDTISGMMVNPSTGDVYVVGTTGSTDLPYTTGAAQSTPDDTFVAKLTGDLTAYYQTTYLGGSKSDKGTAVALNPKNGEIVVAGTTLSTDFPATSAAHQSFNAGKSDAFVARLGADLSSLLGASYIGGTQDELTIASVAVHPTTGQIFVVGETNSTDVLYAGAGSAQATSGGGYDAFVAGFDATLASVYVTYYGSTGTEIPISIAIDTANAGVLICGQSNSTALPNTFGSGQPGNSGGFSDAFVALFDLALTLTKRTTYLGGSGWDVARAMAIDPASGDLYVAGRTDSLDLVGRIGGAQPNRGEGSNDFFVARLDPSLTLVKQTTYLGGGNTDEARAIAVHSGTGDVLVAGYTASDDFPGSAAGSRDRLRGRGDAVVARLSVDLTHLLQSSYLGGLGDDAANALATFLTGDVFLAGSTTSPDLPQAQSVSSGISDGFVARISPDLVALPSALAAAPVGLAVDPSPTFYSNGNGVLEPNEKAAVRSSWKNFTHTAFDGTGEATFLSGPAPGAYFLTDDLATYGSLAPGQSVPCTAGSDCYEILVTQPTTRPATHWDATLQESFSTGDVKAWSVHVGNSFADVPRTHPFYAKIETLLHNGVTGGCSTTSYCPSQAVTRDQMAIFLAKTIAGGAANIPTRGKIDGSPYDCSSGGVSLFADVQPTDSFCKHVHYLAVWGVTRGCTPNQYCTAPPVDRGSMAAFLVRSILIGTPIPTQRNSDPVTRRTYSCNPASPDLFFTDVPATDPFCAPIHYLWARGLVSGCGADTYCPAGLVTRDAMAKFLVNTFDLKLYGP
jgi:hypothetical protein